MRIFQGFVLTFRHRQNNDLGVLAEVEHCRAHEITDVLDHDDRTCAWPELDEPLRDHVGFEMTTRPCIDLDGWRTCASDALAVICGRLVTFDHEQGGLIMQIPNCSLQERRFSRARRTHQIQREYFPTRKPGSVSGCKRVVLGENTGLQLDQLARSRQLICGMHVVVTMIMSGTVRV